MGIETIERAESVQKMDKSRVDYYLQVYVNDAWIFQPIVGDDRVYSHSQDLKTVLDYASNMFNCTKRARIVKRTTIEVNEVVWTRQ